MSRRRPAVAVVGGGVVGCAVAWRLARRDVAVTLFERGQPGGGASSAAAGMLSPLKEAAEPGPFLEFGIRSLERYPDFVERVEADAGMPVGYRQDGRLDVAFSEQAAAALRDQHQLQSAAGLETRLLEPAEIRRLEPAVSEEAMLGLATAFDHQVDSERLARALWLAASRQGVRVAGGVGVAEVMRAPNGARVTGVRLDSGDVVSADAVVIAAGAWAGGLDLPRRLPVRPVRGQIVVLRMVPPVLGRVTWGLDCYLVPRDDGRVLVGASMEEAGFTTVTTAETVHRLLDSALRVVPSLAGAPVGGFQVGLRPGTPDGRPILGPDPRVQGLYYATGHFRNGILLAPETAELLAGAILDNVAVDAAFSLDRFPPGQGSDPGQGSEQSRV